MTEYEIALQFIFASTLTAYPDERMRKDLAEFVDDPELKIPDALRAAVARRIASVAEGEDLASEYIDIFDRGKDANPLYETEYGKSRALAKGSELSDLAGFYRAFGLESGAEGCTVEMLDHVSMELEFYSLLLSKQLLLERESNSEGVEVVLEARKKFLTDHLGRFVASIASRPGVRNSEFYSMTFGWCRDLVAGECTRIEVNPLPANWMPQESDPGKMACGGTVGCT